jgi:hypothetical protein
MSAKELKQQALEEVEELKKMIRTGIPAELEHELILKLLVKVNAVQDLFLQSIKKQSRHLGILFARIEELEK